jgi:serine/threonine protein kinase
MQQLDSPYVLKAYELDRQKTQSWLILEDFDGEPLSGLLDQPIEIDRFLDIARQLVAALVDIHQQDIIHKDLNPAHILVQPKTGAIKLTGFGIASRLLRFPTIQGRGSFIGGSLAYMSPEQIGYLNWGIDHRSDLYSLGIIFYQLLTGKLPFKAADPLEWGHCHVARLPRSPVEIAPTTPKPLSDIVLKLLEKHADKRYQSTRGLLQDLKYCRELWAMKGKIVSFPLGQQDGSNRFLISPKLYGREKEVATLTENFKQVVTTGHTRFMLVSGYSGIGKSALVQALRWPVMEAKGYFISGKFDQYQRDIPYVTLVQAFCDLIQQILTENDKRIQTWKVALQTVLGTNGQIIIDLIPQLERIIGPQPPAPVLPPAEAEHRFHLVFHRFVKVQCIVVAQA